MIQFNPDGSLKLPDHFVKQKAQESAKFNNTACMKIDKFVVESKSPKKCRLTLELSERQQRNDFVQNIFSFFVEKAETPMKLNKVSEKQFEIHVGTSFRRCSECTALISRYREQMDGNVILKTNNCPYEPREFAYEDHFE